MTELTTRGEYDRTNCSDPMSWCVVSKLLPWGYFSDGHYLTVNPACQTDGKLNVQQHSSKCLNTLTVKFFRRWVWETRHSGVTGWELLSHFSDVWCSSLLQLTRSSNWQLESLFRWQMWPHWTYVLNNIIRKKNKSRLTLFDIIARVQKITLPQRYSITADISHCEALNCEPEIEFLSPAGIGYLGSDVIYGGNRHH
jgi:hypothetical protein